MSLRTWVLSTLLLSVSAEALAEPCRGGEVSGIPACPPDRSSEETQLPFGLQPGWLVNLFRTRERPPTARELALRRAWEINSHGIAALNAGNYDLALQYFRQAMAVAPDERSFRINAALAIHNMAANATRSALAAGDYARFDSILQMLNEADRMGGDRRYPNRLRRFIADVRQQLARAEAEARRQEQARLARAEEQRRLDIARQESERRQFAEAQARIANLVQSSGERRTRSRTSGGGNLAFGDPDTIELNPAVRSGRDRTERGAPGRSGANSAGSNLGRLDDIVRGRETLCTGFDGGSCQPHDPVAAPNNASAVQGSPAARIERLNRDPGYRAANEAWGRARDAARQAQANQAALEAQQARTTDARERQRIQIAISNASAETLRARGAERRAEQQRQEVIQQIEIREGAAIMEDGSAPPPPPQSTQRPERPVSPQR